MAESLSPASTRRRTSSEMALAVSDGLSATDNPWHTGQRRSEAMARARAAGERDPWLRPAPPTTRAAAATAAAPLAPHPGLDRRLLAGLVGGRPEVGEVVAVQAPPLSRGQVELPLGGVAHAGGQGDGDDHDTDVDDEPPVEAAVAGHRAAQRSDPPDAGAGAG